MEKSIENFKKWLYGWDLSIESMDDDDNREKMKIILNNAIYLIEKQLSDWELAMIEQDQKDDGTRYLDLKNNPKYNDFKKASDGLTYVMYTLQNVYELKNRRTSEVFKLRGELAELKNKHK